MILFPIGITRILERLMPNSTCRYIYRHVEFGMSNLPSRSGMTILRSQRMQEEQLGRQTRRAIRSFFKEYRQHILRPREFERLISEQRAAWNIVGSVPTADIIRVIREETKLRTIRLAFPGRPETRYVLPGPTVHDIALSLHSDCYLTHHTALFLHGLVDGEPREVYVNLEQSEKPRSDATLFQESIDMAFARAARDKKCGLRRRSTDRLSQRQAKRPVGSDNQESREEHHPPHWDRAIAY